MKWFSRTSLKHDPRPARIVLAEALRQLASGTITNFDFERWISTHQEDRAAREIDEFAWSFYDDFTEHKLRGRHRLSKLQRQVFARCVMFLQTDLEYEYPHNAKWLWAFQRTGWNFGQFFSFLTGQSLRSKADTHTDCTIDDRIWPFARRSDYLEALKHPIYLSGAKK